MNTFSACTLLSDDGSAHNVSRAAAALDGDDDADNECTEDDSTFMVIFGGECLKRHLLQRERPRHLFQQLSFDRLG